MGDVALSLGWDALVVIVPILAVLGLWRFGLDERLATPRQTPKYGDSFVEWIRMAGHSFLIPTGDLGKRLESGKSRPVSHRQPNLIGSIDLIRV